MKHIKFKWLVLLKCLYPKKLPSFKSRPIIEIKRPYISGIHRILHRIFHDIFSLQFSKIYKSEKLIQSLLILRNDYLGFLHQSCLFSVNYFIFRRQHQSTNVGGCVGWQLAAFLNCNCQLVKYIKCFVKAFTCGNLLHYLRQKFREWRIVVKNNALRFLWNLGRDLFLNILTIIISFI